MPVIPIDAGQINFKGPQSASAVDRWFPSVGSLAWTGLALTLAIAIAPPAGALTFTGQTMTVGKTGSADLGVGAVVFTGHVPTVLVSPTPAFGAGAVVWQGLIPAAVVTAPNNPLLGAGALAWQGLILTVRTGDVFIDLEAGSLVFKGPARPQEVPHLQTGALAYQGLTPQVVVSGTGEIGIPAGALAWQGYAPIRTTIITALMGAGQLVLTGEYVAVAFKVPDAGSLIWQGLIPTVVVNTQGSIAIPAGSLVYTGLQNRIDWTTGLPAGTLRFTGQTPQSGQTSTIDIPAGAIAFTGQTPLSIRDIPIALGVGRLVWTSDNQVVPYIDVRPSIPAGSLAFTGLLPTVATNVGDTVVALDAGSLVYTGYAPALIPSVEIFPDAGALTFTGQAPIVLNGLTVDLPAGALTLTGQVMVAQVLSPFLFPAGSLAWDGLRMRVLNTGVTSDVGLFEYYDLFLY